MKHTPEPLQILAGEICDKDNNFIIKDGYIEENLQHRIVSCVNALSGIEDPKRWFENMKFIFEDIKNKNGNINIELLINEALSLLPTNKEPSENE